MQHGALVRHGCRGEHHRGHQHQQPAQRIKSVRSVAVQPGVGTTHVYENDVHDLTEQLDKWHSTVKWRARSLTIGLCVAPLGVAGFVLLWANGT